MPACKRFPHALPCAQKGSGGDRRGITLVDVVITVLILGILAATAAPRFADSLHRMRADAAARRVQADLRWARQEAIAASTSLAVQFTPDSDTYAIPGLPHLNHPGRTYEVDLRESPYRAAIASASLGGDAQVQFNRFGQPDSGGTIAVQSGRFQQSVTIHPDTGMATIP